MNNLSPKAAHSRRGQAGRASPPSNRARPATPSGMSERAQIGLAALCMFGITFMAFSA